MINDQITKSDIIKIQKKAKRIMMLENAGMWDKIKKLPKLDMIFYYIFEDANYHTLNSFLEKFKKLKGQYGSHKAELNWGRYKILGGRTWDIP